MTNRAFLEPNASERRIRLLDPHTVNQIAAGEVVERPASVVKELVENALDSGATRIEVALEDCGKRSIRVSDDGCGMAAEDAVAALERHATSKIRSASDLSAIDTLGFRGEALPSIASVSRMTLSTGCEDGLRYLLTLEGGKPGDPRREAGPKGTDVTVEELFYNTPARLKFLKSDATELSTCVELIGRYAVAYPDVAFTFKNGGSTVLTTSGQGDLLNALAEVWGRDSARGLAQIDCFVAGVRVRGFISPPHFTKPTRAQQWAFVNGRPVRSRTLTAAIDQAYRSLTPEKRHPIALLMLDVDPAKVDANVSPTKSEVRFQSEGAAFDAVRHAIRSALMEHGMAPSAEQLASANGALAGVSTTTRPEGHLTFLGGGFLGSIAAQAPLAGLVEASLQAAVQTESFRAESFLDGLRVIGQLFDTFVIAENSRGLLIVDQHVAHERILYERLRDSRGAGIVERQALLAPETLHLERRAAELLAERLEELAEIGFELEPFGGQSFLVRTVPAAFRGKKPMQALRDIVDELVDSPGAGQATPLRDDVYILCSCKLAVKAGDRLTNAEMTKLIEDLAHTENPYFCPHGRPITIVLESSDLLRKFKRT